MHRLNQTRLELDEKINKSNTNQLSVTMRKILSPRTEYKGQSITTVAEISRPELIAEQKLILTPVTSKHQENGNNSNEAGLLSTTH